MARTLTGNVTESSGQPTYGASVYITDSASNRLYSNESDVRTDSSGNFSISLPAESGNEYRWLKVKDSTTNNITESKIKNSQSVYTFSGSDLGGWTANLDEATVTAKTSKTICEERGGAYNPTTKECKSKTKWGLYAIVGGVGILAIGLIIYGATRKK